MRGAECAWGLILRQHEWLNVLWFSRCLNEEVRLCHRSTLSTPMSEEPCIDLLLCGARYVCSWNHLLCPCSPFLSHIMLWFWCMKISCRRLGIPGHAPPPAAAHQESQQRDSSPPEDQHHSALGAWGPLHSLLLHALPADGMGEPQRWAFKSHLTDWEVSPKVTVETISGV